MCILGSIVSSSSVIPLARPEDGLIDKGRNMEFVCLTSTNKSVVSINFMVIKGFNKSVVFDLTI